jgi:hypothetical protein
MEVFEEKGGWEEEEKWTWGLKSGCFWALYEEEQEQDVMSLG